METVYVLPTSIAIHSFSNRMLISTQDLRKKENESAWNVENQSIRQIVEERNGKTKKKLTQVCPYYLHRQGIVNPQRMGMPQ